MQVLNSYRDFDMRIEEMRREHTQEVCEMMKVFYESPAVWTNGSKEIFLTDIENCINSSPYLEGYVFVEEEALAGYAMLAKSFSTELGKPCIWIEDVYFKPAYRGRGFGSDFLKFVQQKYQDAVIRLEVEEENEAAYHTYQKNGFDVMPYVEMVYHKDGC